MSETEQRTIFGESIDEVVDLTAEGRVIRPFKRMIDSVASEYKLRLSEDTISVEVVDSTNVIMLLIELDTTALKSYLLHEDSVLGISAPIFGTLLQHTRYGKSTEDVVQLSADSRWMESKVNRELGEANVTVRERAELLDPDAIRQSPDLPDLDLGVTVDLEPRTFTEIISALDTGTKKYIKLGSDTNAIIFNQDEDIEHRNIRCEANPTAVSGWTRFSSTYLEDIATGVTNGYIDSLQLRWDEEMPLMVEFERDGIYSGQYMVAPRVPQV